MSYIHGKINEVYWKLYRPPSTDLVAAVCMQHFDEDDYYNECFIRDSDNNIHIFETEQMAINFLNDKFEKEEIDPEYYRGKLSKNIRD